MEILKKIISQILSFMERYILESELITEEEKKMAIDEMKLAAFEFKENYNDVLEILKSNSSKIEKISNETLCRLYSLPPVGNERYFYLALILNLFVYSLYNTLDDEAIELIVNKSNQFEEEYPHFIRILDILINQIYGNQSLSTLGEEELNKIYENLRPVKVEHLEGELKLYHGTAFDSYHKIIEDGFLIATNYSNIKDCSKNSIEKKYYNIQTGYSFFSTDLSYVIKYAMNRGGANAVGATNGIRKLFSIKDTVEWYLNSRGVIFEIDAEKYKDRLYYVPTNGEYLIRGNVDIRDARVIFVNRSKGILTLTDEKGDKIDDLCYE